MKRVFAIMALFVAHLFASPLAMATGCWQGNNPCGSPQGCCSSSAEWSHSGTSDNGTCREIRDCDTNKWLWNGSKALAFCAQWAGDRGNVQGFQGTVCRAWSSNASSGNTIQTNQQCQAFCASMNKARWCNTSASGTRGESDRGCMYARGGGGTACSCAD